MSLRLLGRLRLQEKRRRRCALPAHSKSADHADQVSHGRLPTIFGKEPGIKRWLWGCVAVYAFGMGASHANSWDFNSPFGVAVNSDDVVYVAEIKAKRISKFTPDGESLGTIEEIEGYGTFAGPFDVDIGPHDWVYITDCFAHKVLVLDADENLQFVLGAGTKSMEPGEFAEPHFLTINAAGEIFVADTFNARIQKFSPRGKFIATWGSIGTGPGQFLHNGYLARVDVDNQGFLYVREFDGGRIQKYTEDGEYIATFSKRGVQEGELDEGYGLTVIDGKLYCPDTFESRIQIFSLDGELLEVWDRGEGDTGDQFNHPVDIAQTSTGDLIVSNWKSERVVRLGKDGKLLAEWGMSLGSLLEWQPPRWHQRPTREPIKVGIYAGVDETTLQKSHEVGVDILYPSLNNQYRGWGIKTPVATAASLGIEVHPSIACHPFGNGHPTPSPIFKEHPEWLLWKKDAKKPIETILSWAHPEARTFRADHIVAQVIEQGVQGVMLDYIRYLGTDYGYDPVIVSGFFQKHGVNPLDLPQDDMRWMQYRADFVTDFIVELRHKLALAIPDRHVEISVYLSGDDPAPGVYLKGAMQDWKTWARMGIVDKLHVAWYTRDLDLIYTAVRRVREAVPDRVKVNSFIAAYGGNLNTPELLRKGFEASIAAGADEVTIYRIDAIYELDLWDAIGEIAEDVNAGILGADPTGR